MSTKTTFTTDELIQGIITHGVDIIEHCVVSDSVDDYVSLIEKEYLNYPIPKKDINIENWFMPSKYKDLDITQYILDKCPENPQCIERVQIELAEYDKRKLFPLLKQMVYIIDTLRQNNIVWGVGRGSSVASYVLFLLGVHRIDSIKYNIPLNEFFKGEDNG